MAVMAVGFHLIPLEEEEKTSKPYYVIHIYIYI